MPPPSRPRMLVLNEYYWPGVEATAHLLSELCESLAEHADVTVVTGVPRFHEDDPRRLTRNGVRILRVRSTAFDRTRLTRRIVNYATYLASAFARSVTLQRPDVVLCMTDPPMVGALGVLVARRFGAPLILVSEDVFPEIATALGRLRNRAAVEVLDRIVRFGLLRADRVVAIGETMRRRLQQKGVPEERLRVIPNWVDTTALAPRPRRNGWARRRGLTDRFVVMHSGNVGHAQDLDTLVHAAERLRDRDDIAFAIVGFGARHAEIEALVARLELTNVRLLPYQSRERLPDSLSAADVHVVGLAPGLAGFVVPSRIYGILAVARPVIAAVDEDSETAHIVRDAGCGFHVAPGRPDLLARAILAASEQREQLPELGARGRAWVERHADRTVAMERYRSLLDELVR